jgi:hypothetical protein
MQELLFPQKTTQSNTSFDGYFVVLHNTFEFGLKALLLAKRQDTNGKNWWIVFQRTWLGDEKKYLTHDVVEFKHAEDRARRYFEKKSEEFE